MVLFRVKNQQGVSQISSIHTFVPRAVAAPLPLHPVDLPFNTSHTLELLSGGHRARKLLSQDCHPPGGLSNILLLVMLQSN